MKISEACALFCDVYEDVDKQKTFVGVINNLIEDEDKDIVEYLTYVRDNTEKWMDDALPSYRSYNSKRKLLSGLNAFFSIDGVVGAVGEELMASVQKNVGEALKKIRGGGDDTSSEITIVGGVVPEAYCGVKSCCSEGGAGTNNDDDGEDTSSSDDDSSEFGDIGEKTAQEIIKKLVMENGRLKRRMACLKDIAYSLAKEHSMGETTTKIIEALFDYS